MNKLLAHLTKAELKRLEPELEPVALHFGQVLLEPGDAFKHVYFPVDSLISLLTVVDNHLALEVGMIGCEGMVGTAYALGARVSPTRALVQGAGSALRLPVSAFGREFRRGLRLQQVVLLFTHSLMGQISRTAACNRFHEVDARLARWLLMTRDRVPANEFHLTQEFLADMLGVRRVGVTHAAYALKQHHLIDYSRGTITILDGPGLEAAACSCYQAVKDEGLLK